MSKAWIRHKRPEFVRDVVRDFCYAARELEAQFREFDELGRLSFEILRDVLGEETSKGLLWRLKDTSHHLFRGDPQGSLVGRYLDWAVGYIFHETIKLKEDAYQQLVYGPRFRDMQAEVGSREERLFGQDLARIVTQTRQSMEREITRIRFILFHCRRLLPRFLSSHGDNPLLARFLFEENKLVRLVFGTGYAELVGHVYGEHQEHMYLLAARSLRLGGWMDDAAKAVAEAARIGPNNPGVLQEKEIVDNWMRKLSV